MFADASLKKVLNILLFLTAGITLMNFTSRSASVKTFSKTIKKDSVHPVVITDAALKKDVENLNNILGIYDTLSNFRDYAIKPFHIPKADLDSALEYNSSENKDTINGSVPIYYYQKCILNALNKILGNKHIAEYKLESILYTQYISVVHSDDGRLYNLSFDEKTGGSYRSSLSFMQYRSANGKVYNYGPQMLDSDKDSSGVFSHDGYSNITSIHTNQGIKYLLEGSVLGCNTCVSNYITLVGFKNGDFDEDFTFSLDTREGDGEVSYDPKKQKIYVNYTTDDQRPECDCGSDDNGPSGSIGNEANGLGKKCSCVFKFDGNTFVQEEWEPKRKNKRKP